MTQRYFGDPDAPLFGVHHAPRGLAKSPTRAVLICPPIGQEFVRSHMALRLLAKQIARQGAHVFRFDYPGIGDSAGELEDVHSLATWHQAIKQAVEHLKKASGADSIMLVGLRIGATLAHQVSMESSSINSLLLWEPVLRGDEYLDSLRQMHHEMLDLWVCKMKTENSEFKEEILGAVYSRSLLDELQQLRVDLSQTIQPHAVFVLDKAKPNLSHRFPSLQKLIQAEDVDDWTDLQELEVAWLRSKTTRSIVNTVDEMFSRLHKFGVLAPLYSTAEVPGQFSTGVL